MNFSFLAARLEILPNQHPPQTDRPEVLPNQHALADRPEVLSNQHALADRKTETLPIVCVKKRIN